MNELGIRHGLFAVGSITYRLLTLTASTLTFTAGRTNILQGAIHLVLFVVYVFLIFNP